MHFNYTKMKLHSDNFGKVLVESIQRNKNFENNC